MTPEIQEELQRIAQEYNVHVVFRKWRKGNPGGTWQVNRITIYCRPGLSRTWYLSTLFHELGHLYCYQNGLWKNYHLTRSNIHKIRKIALKAERYVDKHACNTLKKYDPAIEYHMFYSKPGAPEFLKNYYKIN